MKDVGFFKTQIHLSPWQYSFLMTGTFFHPKAENLAVLFQIQLVLLILASACICLPPCCVLLDD